jgi:hypothetical protein
MRFLLVLPGSLLSASSRGVRASSFEGHASQAAHYCLRMKVDENAYGNPSQSQVGKKLRFVHLRKLLDRLHLDNQRLLHEEVDAIAIIEPNALIDDRYWLLRLKWDFPQAEFVGEALLVGRLEQARPQRPMDLDTGSNDKISQFPKSPRLPGSLLHPSRSASGGMGCVQRGDGVAETL